MLSLTQAQDWLQSCTLTCRIMVPTNLPVRREKKMLSLIQTQDRLLYLSFYMLLNLSEDVGVERKMKKKVRGHNK